jgi:hypothetical protein
MAKTNSAIARQLARLSTDCSFLVSHLVRQNAGIKDEAARAILTSILDLNGGGQGPTLRPSKVGWFATAQPNIFNPVTSKFDGASAVEAVCFTESTLAGLRAHRDVFAVKYGVAFDRDWLFERGGNPCLNIGDKLLRKRILREGELYERYVYNFIPPDLHPFINVINEGFDATHEREWRIQGPLSFSTSDALFVFCPEEDWSMFIGVQTAGRPVLFDLAWLDRV